MATSLTPVLITGNTSVDLYAATGIAVGTQVIIQNTGNQSIAISESAVEPISTTGYNVLYPRDFLQSEVTPVGIWATSHTVGNGQLQVEEL